jgi:hypothetical protein
MEKCLYSIRFQHFFPDEMDAIFGKIDEMDDMVGTMDAIFGKNGVMGELVGKMDAIFGKNVEMGELVGKNGCNFWGKK